MYLLGWVFAEQTILIIICLKSHDDQGGVLIFRNL